MAVIRSHSIDSNPVIIANPQVERTRQHQAAELAAAVDSGRQAAEADLAAREQALAQREAQLDQRIAQSRRRVATTGTKLI